MSFIQADIHEHLSQRRSSYNIDYGRNRSGGSASKVDLLKSALEINHKASHSSVASRSDRTSNQSLNRYRADSAPKLNLSIPKSLLIPSAPVLEVINSDERFVWIADRKIVSSSEWIKVIWTACYQLRVSRLTSIIFAGISCIVYHNNGRKGTNLKWWCKFLYEN